MMRWMIILAVSLVCAGCSVERMGPPASVVLTRNIRVPAGRVAVFAPQADLPERRAFIEEIWIKDDGTLTPREMESRLRVLAGARGANAIVLDPLNRRDNGAQVDFKLRFDNPFDYYSAQAIWIGEGQRPVTVLGRRRQ